MLITESLSASLSFSRSLWDGEEMCGSPRSHCHTRVMTTTVQCGSGHQGDGLPHTCVRYAHRQTRQAAWKRRSCCVTSWAHREHQRTGREDGSEARGAQGMKGRDPEQRSHEATRVQPLSGQEEQVGEPGVPMATTLPSLCLSPQGWMLGQHVTAWLSRGRAEMDIPSSRAQGTH